VSGVDRGGAWTGPTLGSGTTRALSHGADAHGTRYLRPGFSWTEQADLRFALGWPHLRFIGPDSAAAQREAAEVIDRGEWFGYPSAMSADGAARYLRAWGGMNPAFGRVVNRDPAVTDALRRPGPLSIDEAQDLLRRAITRRTNGHAPQSEHAVLLLEALFGPETVVLATVEILEGLSPEVAAGKSADRHTVLDTAGLAFLRVHRNSHAALAARWTAVAQRLPDGALRQQIEVVFGGAAAAKHLYRNDVRGYLHAHDDGSAILKPASLGDPVIDTRLVFLAGDPLLEIWARRWTSIRDADGQADLVDRLAELRSPVATRILSTLAIGSKVREAASAALRSRTS
jgi:hypothetical protein